MEENDNFSEFKEKYGNLGTFCVELWREKCLEVVQPGSFSAKNVGVVPEKALKGRPLDVASRLVQMRAVRGDR